MSVDTQMKILLVEDSRAIRKMQIKILKELGFNNLVEANDGEEAIQKLRKEEEIRLIISDWNMPNKNGYELLVWVRSDEKCQAIPFIMATARAEKKEAAKATEAGVSNFLPKLFSAQELQSVIEETFGEGKASEDEAPEEARLPRKTASGKVRLNVAHIQITDHLTLGVLKHLIATQKSSPKYFELETRCMPSWNPVQKALERCSRCRACSHRAKGSYYHRRIVSGDRRSCQHSGVHERQYETHEDQDRSGRICRHPVC